MLSDRQLFLAAIQIKWTLDSKLSLPDKSYHLLVFTLPLALYLYQTDGPEENGLNVKFISE